MGARARGPFEAGGGVRGVKVKLTGVTKLLKSPEVERDLLRRGRAIALAAGEGFEADAVVGRSRVRVGVVTATFEAREAEAKSPRLESALYAGRL